jgi:predicted Zn-dependent peptidase
MTEIYRHTTQAGLDVVGYRLPGRTVSAGVLVGAGAASDPHGHRGISHVLSQAVFQRTIRRSHDELRLALEETGLQKDSALNPEWARYWVRGLAGDLPRALPLLAECVLSPGLAEADVTAAKARARGAVLARREQRELYVSDMLREAIFAGHPLGNRLLGTLSGIGAVSTADIQAFHARYYHAGNMVLGVAGQFDWAAVLDQAEASFPAVTSHRAIAPRVTRLASGAAVGEIQPIPYQHVGLALPGPACGDPDFYTWAVLTHILGWGFTSRLFRTVREQQRLTYAVAARLVANSRTGLTMLYGTTTPAKAGDFAAAVLRTARTLAEQGVSHDELTAAKVQLISELEMRGESTAARLHTVLTSAYLEPEVRSIGRIRAAIESVQPADIQRVLAAWRPDQPPALATVGPVPCEEVYSHVGPALQLA